MEIILTHYLILFIIFIVIVYLLVLRSRIDEFFENQNNSNNTPNTNEETQDSIFVKKDVNPYEIEKIYEGKLTDDGNYLSIWQRKNKKTQNLFSFGQFAMTNKEQLEALPDEIVPNVQILNMLVTGGKFPIKYVKIWSSETSKFKPELDFSIWQAIAPDGYVALGDVVSPSLSEPSRTAIVCLPISVLNDNEQFKNLIYKHDTIENPFSIWNVGNYKTFIAGQNITHPDIRKEDIKDIKQDVLDRKEIDPEETYKSVTVKLATYKLTNTEKNESINQSNLNTNDTNNTNNTNNIDVFNNK
jgi:hypothetical protein